MSDLALAIWLVGFALFLISPGVPTVVLWAIMSIPVYISVMPPKPAGERNDPHE